MSKKDTLELFKKAREDLEVKKYKRDQEAEDELKERHSKPHDEQFEEAKSITSGWERYERGTGRQYEEGYKDLLWNR